MTVKHLLMALLVWCFLSVGVAQGEQVVAVAPGNLLVLFDTASPTSITVRPITGLGANETVRGIDYRPATGELVISSVTAASANNSIIRTYKVDSTTGAATLIGATASALPGAGDIPTGYDFNPTVDRIRYVNTNDENARINPTTGALAADDTDLTPAATNTIIALAYDRNSPGGPATTAYVIDRVDNAIATLGGVNATPSPNGGVITEFCALGFNLHATNDGGFDIAPGGSAFAALTSAATGLTSLYQVVFNVDGCTVTVVGLIGAGTEIYSLTILPPDTDSDGVRDPLDGCPNDAAKTAAGTCGCGTADADTDGDGVLDCNDNCPNAVNPGQEDIDGDGFGDACPNSQAVLCGASACGGCGPGVVTMMPLTAFAIYARRRRLFRRPGRE